MKRILLVLLLTFIVLAGNTQNELSAQVKTFTINGVSFDMIFVEGGTFMMGATSEQGSNAFDDEKPAHQVVATNYYIGKTEVTQALWRAVMENSTSHSTEDNLPIRMVSWKDCQQFIKRLNQLTGQNFRLPTEAEWEYAARGGNKSKGYKYAGSNDIYEVAWHLSNSGHNPHIVASKFPNELGIYDMSGNVWEWCQDWKENYSSSHQDNTQVPAEETLRVFRGGSFDYDARSCRVSYRGSGATNFKFFNLGFRICLSENENSE